MSSNVPFLTWIFFNVFISLCSMYQNVLLSTHIWMQVAPIQQPNNVVLQLLIMSIGITYSGTREMTSR